MVEDPKARLERLREAKAAKQRAEVAENKASDDRAEVERRLSELERDFKRRGVVDRNQMTAIQSQIELLSEISQNESRHLQEMIQSISNNNLLASEDMRDERRRETGDLLAMLRELL